MTLLDLLTKSQGELGETLAALNNPYYTKITNKGGFIFKPKHCESYPLICVHLDTINDARQQPAPLLHEIIQTHDIIKLSNNAGAVCLGGDDRCGVYIALSLMKENTPFAFGFFIDEEIGGVGSQALSNFIDTLNITAFVGLDRKGFNECATYGYDNAELISIFTDVGYVKAHGSFTDASNLSMLSNKDTACLNLSVGYYNEHTKDEFIIPLATERTLAILKNKDIITKLSSKHFKATRATYNYSKGYSYWEDTWGVDYDTKEGFVYSYTYGEYLTLNEAVWDEDIGDYILATDVIDSGEDFDNSFYYSDELLDDINIKETYEYNTKQTPKSI